MKSKGSIVYKTIEEVNEVNEVVLLQAQIWGHDTVTPTAQLVASSHHGGIIMGAFCEEKLIGFCYGFPGFKDGKNYLISHMAAVLPKFQNLGVGYQLKLNQREWAMEYGYQKILWTFDPLEVRNGYFNLCKLGGYTRKYIPSYYGEMDDNLNKGLPSDRFLIEWDICSERVEKAIRGGRMNDEVKDYEILFSSEKVGDVPYPVEKETYPQNKGYLVPVPANIQSLKQTNMEAAKAWRYVLRHIFIEFFSKGYVVTGVLKSPDSNVHYYVLEYLDLEKSK